MGQNAEKKDNDELTLTPLDEMEFSVESEDEQDFGAFETPKDSKSEPEEDFQLQDFNEPEDGEPFPSIEDDFPQEESDNDSDEESHEKSGEPSKQSSASSPAPLTPESELLTRDPSFGPDEDEDRSLDLDEVRDFAEQEQLKPSKKEFFPYSILLRKIRYEEDIKLIIEALEKTEMDFDLESMKKQAQRGKLLIPRISEYIAMFITHQIRSIDAEIMAAPSDEIPLAYQKEQTGPHTLRKKKQDYDKQYSGRIMGPMPDGPKDVIVTTGPNIPEKTIFQYKGVLSHSQLFKMTNLESPNLDSYTQQVVEVLKKKAHEKSCHGIIGLQIQPSETSMGLRIFVSGTAVQFKRSSDHS